MGQISEYFFESTFFYWKPFLILKFDHIIANKPIYQSPYNITPCCVTFSWCWMCVCVWFCVRIQTLNLCVTCFMLSCTLHSVCYWSLLFVCAVCIYLMWLMSFERALFCIQAKWPRPRHPCQALLQVSLSLFYVWVCVSYGVDANQTLPVIRTSHRYRTS